MSKRSVPSAVLRADGWPGSAVLPQSQTWSTSKAAAVRMMDPTLNGCPTLSSSNPSRASVRRRQPRLRRLTSVMPSCRGVIGAVAVSSAHFQYPVAGARGDSIRLPARLSQPALERVRAKVALDHQMGGGAGREAAQPRRQQLMKRRLSDPDRRVGPDQLIAGRQISAGVSQTAPDVAEPGFGGVALAQL